MGIKSFNPYTPSRRHMTSSDFNEITKSTPETEENTESSTSREEKMMFRQPLNRSSTIRTEQQTSL